MTEANQSITTLESVLDLAIALERAGQEFYENAGRGTSDPQLAELFAWLAAEEKKHGVVYAQFYERFVGQTAETAELLGEYGQFIGLLRREVVGSLQFAPGDTAYDLLATALRFERDTLLYFHEIGGLFPVADRAPIHAICAEERRHIRALLEARQRLAD